MDEQTLTDAEIETGGTVVMEMEADSDGTDGDSDGSDADGTDGDGTDGTDGDGSDADADGDDAASSRSARRSSSPSTGSSGRSPCRGPRRVASTIFCRSRTSSGWSPPEACAHRG
jgi:hypothetical protein